jgi:hypothetical protein
VPILLQKSPKRKRPLAPGKLSLPLALRAVAGDHSNDCQRDFGVT